MIWSAVLLREAETLLEQRDLQAALAQFQSAERQGANARYCLYGKWMTHMLGGNFEAAWRESDRARAWGLDNGAAFWRGEDIAGKHIIVRCLHGFGDAVQFMRFAPRLQMRAKNVIWEVPPELVELAPCFDGVEHVVSWGGDRISPLWEVQTEVTELAFLFRTQLDDLPIATRYLHLPYGLVRKVSAAMGRPQLPRVGLAWAAGDWNTSRSIPIALFVDLLRSRDCEFWNLQGGPERKQWDYLPKEISGRSTEACRDGILGLAAVISQLDLVITVDTLATHLAGALEVPAWVMLQYSADWRWMVDRDDSPWYPSLRLFRQRSSRDWQGVVDRIGAELTEWVRAPYRRLAA